MKSIKEIIEKEFKVGDDITMITKYGPLTAVIEEFHPYYIKIGKCNPEFPYLSYDILYKDILDLCIVDCDLGI
jgi:hypothetical protein